MCGAYQQEDNNKLDREAANRMKDAENIGVLQGQINNNNSYGQFLNDATAAPKNVLDIIGNFNKKNSALDQIMEQENF
tara:strand:- start:5736 stop:5969 length:234 start_codon:yes stop_codon:yes gene_type:complete